MKTLHTAVIGCGLISKNHLKALKNVEHAECVAVCDIVLEKAETTAESYKIPQVYTDYKEMLKNPDIDVIHICTPHYLHAEMAIDTLNAGKHVLCEKPMALSEADALQMMRARDRSGKQLGICFQNRYNQASVYMKKLLEKGGLGPVTGARGQVTWDRKPEYYTQSLWRGRWATEGGGVLINQAIHTFDLMQWLAGCRIKTVEASVSTKRLKEVIEVEDTVDVLMTGQNGERVLFYATNCYVKNAPVELEIICENGSVKMTGNVVVTEKDGTIVSKDYFSGTVLGKDYWGSGHGFLIDDFYRCIEENRRFPVGGEEAITSVRLLEAVYRSGREGSTVTLQGDCESSRTEVKNGEGGCR